MSAIVSKALEAELRDGEEFSAELDLLMRKAQGERFSQGAVA